MYIICPTTCNRKLHKCRKHSTKLSKCKFLQKVWFVDPIETKIGIILDKHDDHGYFSHGLWNVLKHYNLVDGAWLKVYYQGDNEFRIKVKDLYTSEILYPLPPKEYDFVLKYLPPEFHDYTTPGRSQKRLTSMERWEIKLTLKQATISNMVICLFIFFYYI